MKKTVVNHNLPAIAFPLTIEALHPLTREVVWSKTVQQPPPGTKSRIEIPPLARELGYPVAMRITFANGTVQTNEPSITCPRCGKTSYDLRDIQERYCSFCHDWHDNMPPC